MYTAVQVDWNGEPAKGDDKDRWVPLGPKGMCVVGPGPCISLTQTLQQPLN